ncbi:toxin-antitoxin system YwqK family antitoxin [Emticicia sp. 21SJ11W-3]|uniref:toxin-antitoxin system YwqK family antitoxin n=1 Tax=Emticicia sp. 21SJ11W-3 TaxID=2916755 RepID=UPI00209CC965|nr:hypothetical protein [Emticicia sp. 21SJ11W-3]UTA66512.1 hypothetical protein MB380_12975 [Emticicia sp. 21SJ11W-3]
MIKTSPYYRIIRFSLMLLSVMLLSCHDSQQKTEIKWQTLANGEKKPMGMLVDNKKKGMWIEYQDNGEIGVIRSYNNNILNGPCMYFGSDGKLYSKKEYVDSTYHGEYIVYNCDSKCIRLKGFYDHGKPVKVWDFYPPCDCRLSRRVDYGEDGNKNDTLIENHIEPIFPTDHYKNFKIDNQ